MARLDEQYADLDLGLAELSVVILARRFGQQLIEVSQRPVPGAVLQGASFGFAAHGAGGQAGETPMLTTRCSLSPVAILVLPPVKSGTTVAGCSIQPRRHSQRVVVLSD